MAESNLHKTIKDKSVEYLRNKGYRISRAEVHDHYYGIIDAWGIDQGSLYTMGLEVKVSRSDWKAARHKDRRAEEVRKDPRLDSWTATNELYYVCPVGLIQPEEVAESTGLLWYNSQTDRFINKKKPYFLKVTLKAKIQTLLNLYEPFYPQY